MPRYDFSCTTCGERFEQHIPFGNDHAKVSCPHGHGTVRRVYSPPSVVFKGSGWYVTDHKSAGKAASASAEAS